MSVNYITVQNDVFLTPGVTNNFQPVNPNGFPGACSIVRIVNNSANPVILSFNGINEHDTVLANSVYQLDLQTNNSSTPGIAKFKKGTVVYIAGPVPAVAGNVSVSCYYQPEL